MLAFELLRGWFDFTQEISNYRARWKETPCLLGKRQGETTPPRKSWRQV
jgi:hypothetical protein